ncbi:hypothetical protein WA026_015941 [Henosepilachna vigintioctopunctata]|uniref:Uncharacterized protein n=1 Tax=Henosepilachna vigintioctopunctata TaxID=420089 RepID=A0AAW1UA51_9CUCU
MQISFPLWEVYYFLSIEGLLNPFIVMNNWSDGDTDDLQMSACIKSQKLLVENESIVRLLCLFRCCKLVLFLNNKALKTSSSHYQEYTMLLIMGYGLMDCLDNGLTIRKICRVFNIFSET